MKSRILYILVFFAFVASGLTPALAQEMPAPRKMPRVPVHRESMQEHKAAVPATREVQGQAVVVDGEKLRIGELDLRLFGVVPPQLSASFGPQARGALDELTSGQIVTCAIRDRDREERFLATCRNASNADLALELLRRGLAVTARGSLASTDLAAPYVAAEQLAATQKVGLWSMAVSVGANAEAPKAEAVVPPVQPAAAPVHSKAAEEKSASVVTEQNQVNVVTEPVAKSAPTPAAPVASYNAVAYAPFSEPFLARYQLLVTGLIMLLTALGVFGAITIQRLRDKRAEMQAIAAAFRGELMAAHAICRSRLRSSAETEDRDIVWPRLRSTLYQAYVGRLGWLGADLSRRIASIYGQASDYAAYYSTDDEMRTVALPKRQALQTLVQHIDEVLPRLAIIEHTGNPSSTAMALSRQVNIASVPAPLPPPPQPPKLARPAANSRPVPQKRATVTVTGVSVGNGEPASPPSAAFSPAQIWTAVQKLARTPWTKKKTVEVRDPIAEYTALIEEEMKRFSFLEDDETEQQMSVDTAAAHWPQKANEAF